MADTVSFRPASTFSRLQLSKYVLIWISARHSRRNPALAVHQSESVLRLTPSAAASVIVHCWSVCGCASCCRICSLDSRRSTGRKSQRAADGLSQDEGMSGPCWSIWPPVDRLHHGVADPILLARATSTAPSHKRSQVENEINVLGSDWKAGPVETRRRPRPGTACSSPHLRRPSAGSGFQSRISKYLSKLDAFLARVHSAFASKLVAAHRMAYLAIAKGRRPGLKLV